MPVADRESHVMVRRASDAPYGCKDRVIGAGYWTHQRHYFPNGKYVMREVFIEHRMSIGCRYYKSREDPRCANCRHLGAGDKYHAAASTAAA